MTWSSCSGKLSVCAWRVRCCLRRIAQRRDLPACRRLRRDQYVRHTHALASRSTVQFCRCQAARTAPTRPSCSLSSCRATTTCHWRPRRRASSRTSAAGWWTRRRSTCSASASTPSNREHSLPFARPLGESRAFCLALCLADCVPATDSVLRILCGQLCEIGRPDAGGHLLLPRRRV
jgi:hypothetical protein